MPTTIIFGVVPAHLGFAGRSTACFKRSGRVCPNRDASHAPVLHWTWVHQPDEQSLVRGLPGIKCDMLHLVSGVVRHCCDSLEVRERAWKHLVPEPGQLNTILEQTAHDHERGLLFDDAIPEPELDGEGGESPPCGEAGESEPDQPWEEEDIEAEIAVPAAPVEKPPSRTKDISRFLALRLAYGSASAKDLSAASSS
eukprot:5971724-Amphidinium_carterae.1